LASTSVGPSRAIVALEIFTAPAEAAVLVLLGAGGEVAAVKPVDDLLEPPHPAMTSARAAVTRSTPRLFTESSFRIRRRVSR
jgi:hypothetical protein